MLFLQIALLLSLLPCGDSENDFQEPITFKIIRISSFYSQFFAQNLGSAWLDELQTHAWDNNSDRVIYLRPWSKGNFSNEELMDVENVLHTFFIRLGQVLHNHASQWRLEYPFELQIAGGCEMHIRDASVGFVRIGYQGSDFLSFQKDVWVPSPEGGISAQFVCTLFNLYRGTQEIIHKLLSDTCPRFLLSLLDAGKAYLQRQVRPEAWLSPGPSPGPGQLMLVCHVSGFYPKPIWVMWMRGEQEQQGTQRSDVLPNADGTWYLRVSLDVEASEASGLSCRVRHSSLGGQDIILYWDHHSSTGWIILAMIVPLVLLAGLAFWLRKSWTCCKPSNTLLPLERGPSSPRT
ncbi:PREDICTED: T-cell surface glycoprotein CD1a-like isoform X1 [Bison bison bison]|uniref:T-cell surface glycoprotein CD1a-like isoform X1 n=1 Tax=Bison bison bison TaxID=43346 RepID=A0A6P3I0H3_BISBB|nr:PREDICTED: T-cell surface glycoprotein CD1a-like isoform X1 [Bison bison bison]